MIHDMARLSVLYRYVIGTQSREVIAKTQHFHQQTLARDLPIISVAHHTDTANYE